MQLVVPIRLGVRECKRVMKAHKAVEGKESKPCRNEHTCEHIETEGFQAKLVLIEVFIAEGDQEEQPCRAGEGRQKTRNAGQPPGTATHKVETQQREKKEE